VKRYRRWSIRLEFSLLDEAIEVSAFFNLGANPDEPFIGRRSRYFEAWSQTNGGPPKNGQRMTPATFIDPTLLYTVRVEDATKDSDEQEKPDALVYSRVTKILKVEQG